MITKSSCVDFCIGLIFVHVISISFLAENGQFHAAVMASSDTSTFTGEAPTELPDAPTRMFKLMSHKWLKYVKTDQKNYGVAVADVDMDGDFEFIVAGSNGPNLVLKYDRGRQVRKLRNIALEGSRYEGLIDEKGHATGVCACDIDGDGKEEIYFLNTNDAFAGETSYSDKLFKWKDGGYVDLYSDRLNWRVAAKNFAGHSVSCIDRRGNGKYGFAIAAYAKGNIGTIALVEMNEFHPENNPDAGKIVLHNVAHEAGIDNATGARGLAVGPILSEGAIQDLFFTTEGSTWLANVGANLLFKYTKYGKFKEVAWDYGLRDEKYHGRGVVLADFNHDGLFDLVVANSKGPNRLYIQVYADDDHSKSQTKPLNESSNAERDNKTIKETDRNLGNVSEKRVMGKIVQKTVTDKKNETVSVDGNLKTVNKTNEKKPKIIKSKKRTKKVKKSKKSKKRKQKKEEEGKVERKRKFVNIATPAFEAPVVVRTVIAADFDNDGYTEVFFNNMKDVDKQQPNRLFSIMSDGPGQLPRIVIRDIGDAEEKDGHGTGAAVMDINGDGRLELLISRGESAVQSVEIYRVLPGKKNNWVRVVVRTQHGAPARGAVVRITTKSGKNKTALIDNGSGYLCQMEPVAHFGLGSDEASEIYVQWPDGLNITRTSPDVIQNSVHYIHHPDRYNYKKKSTGREEL